MPKKYVTTKVGDIIMQVAKPSDIRGYTEGVIECFLPDENTMNKKQIAQWIKENNIRMQAICDFLNKENL